MKKVLILAANGQISRLVIKKLKRKMKSLDIELSLFLRNKSRLEDLEDENTKLIEGDLNNEDDLISASKNQDIVFVGVVDHSDNNKISKNIIKAMKINNVDRIIALNILGIYDEVEGEFGRWNYDMVKSGLTTAKNSDKLYKNSNLDYTGLRLAWLNDRDEIKYSITYENETFIGVSVSRKSVADLVAKIILDDSLYKNESIGVADKDTQGLDRPVY